MPSCSRSCRLHHYVADLLAEVNYDTIPSGSKIKGLNIGVGANCIYPIFGNAIYGWSFVGFDIDKTALEAAPKTVSGNKQLTENVTLKNQPFTALNFRNILKSNEKFDFVMCNPSFHVSAEEVRQVGLKKVRKLTGKDIQQCCQKFQWSSCRVVV